jgi:hypothetical protein
VQCGEPGRRLTSPAQPLDAQPAAVVHKRLLQVEEQDGGIFEVRDA